MKLTERLNVLIQAVTLSQKGGALTLDDAVKAKSAIDVISSGTLNQNFAAAINVLIEFAVSSQTKGVYTLKDAYMIYLAIDGIEIEFQNEVNKITVNTVNDEVENEISSVATNVLDESDTNNENIIIIPPKKLKKK